VNTNINSYDRTEPFHAFNCLLKLLGASLGALPGRLGGCQYRLTPEEHRLSLHLLTIVEPFVGLAPSRRTITRQPTEILDVITSFLESKGDLLALSLSCRRMYDVVFERHLHYRLIRAKISSLSVWHHLFVHKSLARNVRQLEIIDERSSESVLVPPCILTSDTDLESTDDELGLHEKQERFFVSALGQMTQLITFSWSCNHSPLSIDGIWLTLLKCGSLRDINITDNLVFSPPSAGTNLCSDAPRRALLPEVKNIALRSTKHAYGASKNPSISRIRGILDQCPNIEVLDVQYERPRVMGNVQVPASEELLLYGRWSRLTALTLTNLRCATAGLEAISSFLYAHAGLQVLHLDITHAGFQQLTLLPNTLPHLRELQAHRNFVSMLLECPCDIPRPLEVLKGLRLTSVPDDNTKVDGRLLANLRLHGQSVRRIELMGWTEMEDLRRLAESVPGLAWLDVG
ncbi:hypothetical protein FISHEDRAFT_21472, partial [Fistulina hepatica ATCC 64428]